MKPPLSPAHGTSLGTTAGITAVIAVVAAVSVWGQRRDLFGRAALLADAALVAFALAAGWLYSGRNEIGRALDLAPGDGKGSGVAAARGLARFHLGIACVFTGAGLTAAFRLRADAGLEWLMPAVPFAFAAVALGKAIAWAGEARRRRTS